jgi:glycosyltransferase involved in cell wall biosynthesis
MTKTLCIYAGYTPPFNGNNYKNQDVYGSEMNIIQIGELMVEKYNYEVYIFVIGLIKNNMEIIYNGVHYIDTIRYNNFNKPIDVMLVNRYIHFFIYFKSRAIKTYFYIQDTVPNYSYNDIFLPFNGQSLFYNICKNNLIDGIVCISEWQKQNTLNNFDILDTPIHIIGNGINSNIPKKNLDKIIKNRFIYCSGPTRGLSLFLDCIIELQKYIADCSIVVFRSSEFDENINNKLKLINNKTIYDKVSHDIVIKEFIQSDIWFYPTHFNETYCNCATEAQLYNTVCVYNNVGCLNTTIGNRGVKLNPNEPDYITYAVNNLVKIIHNPEIKNRLREKGYEWAKKQVFDNKIKEWFNLLN